MNARERLFEEICLIVTDEDARNRIYIALDHYEVQQRNTSIALVKEDRNEYLLKNFIIAKTVKGCTPRTLQCYTETVRAVLGKIGKTVDDITASDIRLYTANRLYKDGITKVTALNEQRVLSSFFRWLSDQEFLTRNPMVQVDRIKKPKTQKEAFTRIEIEKMREAIEVVSPKRNIARDKALIELLLSTGCRVTEASEIEIDNINGNEILVHGKGEKDRIVYLNAKAMYALENYIKKRSTGSPYLFPGNCYGHLGSSGIESLIRKCGRACGVKAYPHKFRRTFATFALQRGMPIEQVSRLLGHESVETTQIYLDLDHHDIKEAHRKFVV